MIGVRSDGLRRKCRKFSVLLQPYLNARTSGEGSQNDLFSVSSITCVKSVDSNQPLMVLLEVRI